MVADGLQVFELKWEVRSGVWRRSFGHADDTVIG